MTPTMTGELMRLCPSTGNSSETADEHLTTVTRMYMGRDLSFQVFWFAILDGFGVFGIQEHSAVVFLGYGFTEFWGRKTAFLVSGEKRQ